MFLLRNQQRNVERARKHRFPPFSTPYLIPFLAISLSFPIRTNVSSFSARKDPSRGFSIPFSTRVEPRMNLYIYCVYVCMYMHMYKRRDERRITRAREQRRTRTWRKVAAAFAYTPTGSAVFTFVVRRYFKRSPHRHLPPPLLAPPFAPPPPAPPARHP